MLVLRSLVPAGFMLAPVNGGLAVVLCDADATAAMYGHAGHEMFGAAHGMSGADVSAATHGTPGHDMSAATRGTPGHDMSGAAHGTPGHDMSGAAHGTPGHDMSGAAHGTPGHDMSMPGHDMSGHDLTGRGHTHPDPTCPYAQSSGASPLPFFAPITAAIAPSTPVLPDFTAQTHAHFGPTRQQSPRGPPRLA